MCRDALIASLYPVMLFQRSASFSGVVKASAAATSVATFVRSPIAFPFPRGCTEFVSKMMYVCVVGSIHTDVPVNPVCPYDPTGSSRQRFDEDAISISPQHPRSTAVD